MASTHSAQPHRPSQRDRQAWLAVLARVSLNDLERVWNALPQQPAFRWLRPPEAT